MKKRKTILQLLHLIAALSITSGYAEEMKSLSPNDVKTEDSPEIEKAIDDSFLVEKNVPSKPEDKDKKEQPVASTKLPMKKAERLVSPTPVASPKAVVEKKVPVKPEKIQVIVKEVKSKKNHVSKLSNDEASFLAALDKKTPVSTGSVRVPEKKMPSKAYEPAPTQSQEEKHEGFMADRDSSEVLRKKMSYTDALTVKMCYQNGLSIVLDDDITTEFQRVIIDDKLYFDAIDFDNHRWVYVKLKQPVPENRYWSSSIRLVRKDNDKTYLINLSGVHCPKEGNPYPRVIYLQDKVAGISGKNSKIMTPEDTIIGLSEGFPRKNVNKINVYDMVARSGSEWVVFGVEVRLPEGEKISPEKFMLRMIDNLQIYQVPTKIEFLPVQSEKASQAAGSSALRYKILVNVDKQYFIENRYLHLMLLDKKGEYYQYVRIDTLPYVLKLRERGFDI